MNISIQTLFRQYLRMQGSIADLRDWLALYQWNLSESDQVLADEADVALAHLDDGYGDEVDLRERLALVLERYVINTVYFDFRAYWPAPVVPPNIHRIASSTVAQERLVVPVAVY